MLGNTDTVTDQISSQVRHMKLCNCSAGTRAEVLHIDLIDCAPALRHRLLSVGVLPGAIVEIVAIAPLGDPIQIRIQGSLFAIRRNEACGVIVRLLSSDE